MGDQITLCYVHDPMCSWCWAFRNSWQRIVEQLPAGVLVQRLLGGLAPDSEAPMAREMRDYLQQTWRTIQRRVPGTEFNFDFWQQCEPRRSTYPACRAVIAAREQGEHFEERMILAIQQGYYLQARNPSIDTELIGFAAEIGLDRERFAAHLRAPSTQALLEEEIAQGRRMGAQGFPSLILQRAGRFQMLSYDYNDPQPVLNQIGQLAG